MDVMSEPYANNHIKFLFTHILSIVLYCCRMMDSVFNEPGLSTLCDMPCPINRGLSGIIDHSAPPGLEVAEV